MIDEFDLVFKLVKMFDLPPSAVGGIFATGMFIRSKMKKHKEKVEEVAKAKKEEVDRKRDLEVGRQMDYIYSKAYLDMESRVYNIHLKGKKVIEVRINEGIEDVPLGAYKVGYKEALKEVAFKIVKPCIIDKLHSDKIHYLGSDYEMYIVDTGQDIHHSFTSALGRKTGITEFSEYIEQDVLTERVFYEMFSKIIRRAREESILLT